MRRVWDSRNRSCSHLIPQTTTQDHIVSKHGRGAYTVWLAPPPSPHAIPIPVRTKGVKLVPPPPLPRAVRIPVKNKGWGRVKGDVQPTIPNN